MANFKPGDVVIVKVRRRGDVDAVVVGTRRYQRGRHAGQTEYTLAPLNRPEGTKAYFVTGNASFVRACDRRYSADAIARATETQEQVAGSRDSNRRKRADANEEHLADLEREHGQIMKGDEVLIKYTDVGQRWELVGEVKGGRIGIVRRDIDRIIEHNRVRAGMNAQLEELSGVSMRRGIKRELRWLGARAVVGVRKLRAGLDRAAIGGAASELDLAMSAAQRKSA